MPSQRRGRVLLIAVIAIVFLFFYYSVSFFISFFSFVWVLLANIREYIL